MDTVNYEYGYIDTKTNVVTYYDIKSNLVPETSLLRIMHLHDSDEQGIAYTEDSNIAYVIQYLNTRPIVRDELAEEVLKAWGVYDDYNIIWDDEQTMRINIYRPGFETHDVNTDHYFNLVKMDEFRQQQEIGSVDYSKPDNLLFNSPYSFVIDYNETFEYLYVFDFIFEEASSRGINAVIAGEYVFRTLTGFDDFIDVLPFDANRFEQESWSETMDEVEKKLKYNSGVNVFLFDVTFDSISDYLDAIIERAESIVAITTSDAITEVSRTPDFISISIDVFDVRVLRINISLELYNTFSEVLHSFDVDSNCVGYDGGDVWCTKRCEYAMLGGFNTLNFDLLSLAYQDRLVKSGTLGMCIRVPGIDDYTIKRSEIQINDYVKQEPIINIELKRLISGLTLMSDYIDPLFEDNIESLAKQYRYIEGSYPDKVDKRDYMSMMYYTHLTGLSRMLDYEFQFIAKKEPFKIIFDIFDNEIGLGLRTTRILSQLARAHSEREYSSASSRKRTNKLLYSVINNELHIHRLEAQMVDFQMDIISVPAREGKIIDKLYISDDLYELIKLLFVTELKQDVTFTWSEGRMINDRNQKIKKSEDWYVGKYVEPK